MERLLAGESAIERLALFEVPGLASDLAASVAGLDVQAVRAELAGVGRWSRADAMAVLAAREALAEAGAESRGTALFLGGSTGGTFESELALAALKRDIDADVDREALSTHPISASLDRVHEVLGPFARATAVCSACSGGATAILLAANAIRHGRVERALAGGVDALCRLTYAGFSALGAVDREPCRPFDATRRGLTLGEGAAFLMLESEASARARGRTPIAELAGWAVASEAHHITHPEPSGAIAAAVMTRAIADAGLSVADIDYVNAHGTATPHNDPMETAAIRRCFGERADEVWVSSVKGSIGHTLGAAGAIEAVITALAVAGDRIPPTVGLSQPDPECRLAHAMRSQHTPLRAAITNAFGFGGTDTSLVLRKADPRPTDPGPSEADTPTPPRRLAITGAACIGPLGLFGGATLDGVVAYAEPGPLPADVPCELPVGLLDGMRARRLDRASRLTTVVASMALGDGVDPCTAVVVGTAHGGVSATGQVLRRVFERGPRFASPALFPSVLPSALASHPSIYLGLTGPALSCSDLSTSAELAFSLALDLVRDGAAPVAVAAAVDEHNEVAARISGPALCGLPDRRARAEGAAALAIEPWEAAGPRALAEVVWGAAWRGRPPALPVPAEGALLFTARHGEVPAPWSGVARRVLADRAGDHESVGGVALVTAVSALVSRRTTEALVLGCGPDRGYAWVLRACP